MATTPTTTTNNATASTSSQETAAAAVADDNQIHNMQTKFLQLGELYAEALESIGKDNKDEARGKSIVVCLDEVRVAIGGLRGVEKSEAEHEAELRELMKEDEAVSSELERVAEEAKNALRHVRRVRRRLGEELFLS